MKPQLRKIIQAAVVVITTGGAIHEVQAALLSFSFTDPNGDAFLFPGEVGPVTDVVGLSFLLDNITGNYEVLVTASSDSPFIGDVRINVNLYNGNLGTLFTDTANDCPLDTGKGPLANSRDNLRNLLS